MVFIREKYASKRKNINIFVHINLVVDGLGGGFHDDVAPLTIDFGVELERGIPDEIDDPVFSILLRHVQFQCQFVD